MLCKYKGLVKINSEHSWIDPQEDKLNTVIYDFHSIVVVEVHFIFDKEEEQSEWDHEED